MRRCTCSRMYCRVYPMEVLALDGIFRGYPPGIKSIATHLPDLLVLTIFLRGGPNQRASIHCMWPKPIWTYAPYFAQFTRLRHFEYNHQYFCDEVITPWSMLLLDGYGDQDGFVQPYRGLRVGRLRRARTRSVRNFGVQGLLPGARAEGSLPP